MLFSTTYKGGINNLMFTLYSILFIVTIILIAHFIAPKEYNWRINTISELAAQKYRYKMVMQIGFIGFGGLLSAAIILIWISRSFQIKYIPIMVYSISVLLSGIFSTMPFGNDTDYSIKESRLHSFFAQLAGFSFSLGILIFFFYTDNITLKVIHFSFFLFVIFVSFLFGKVKVNKGILQRILYFGSFLWILLFLR
jgi:hypothetical protein